jgi:hypothetical protein
MDVRFVPKADIAKSTTCYWGSEIRRDGVNKIKRTHNIKNPHQQFRASRLYRDLLRCPLYP